MAVYGLFVFLPGILIVLVVTIGWLKRSAEPPLRVGQRPPSPLALLVALMARAGVANTAIAIAFRCLNDPADGDPPLSPFIYTVPSIVVISFLMSAPFAARYLNSRRKARQTEVEEVVQL